MVLLGGDSGGDLLLMWSWSETSWRVSLGADVGTLGRWGSCRGRWTCPWVWPTVPERGASLDLRQYYKESGWIKYLLLWWWPLESTTWQNKNENIIWTPTLTTRWSRRLGSLKLDLIQKFKFAARTVLVPTEPWKKEWKAVVVPVEETPESLIL